MKLLDKLNEDILQPMLLDLKLIQSMKLMV